ncbi:MAG: hypothetical protein IT436_15715 [Phycisphaerales bacterium]|nr:hypothetical protein [Phycisphaerales bacterium]
MGLVLAGVDEAGYGPLLGPLCVGMAAVRLDDDRGDPAAIDLWKLLRRGVCSAPDERRGRVAIADSKVLKLANSSKARHPVAWLERGVLAFMRARGLEVRTDLDLFDRLGIAGPGHRCYAGDPFPMPLSWSAPQIAIAANVLLGALSPCGVSVADVACSVVGEDAFNDTVSRTGSKAHTTIGAMRGLLRRLIDGAAAGPGDRVWLVCDRLGGRARYAETLEDLLPGSRVVIEFETDRESRYTTSVNGRELVISFLVESESQHLPTALASMAAKLIRELYMLRFNRYWSGLKPELKPTAGYRGDAQRWLQEADGLLSVEDRRSLIRLA